MTGTAPGTHSRQGAAWRWLVHAVTLAVPVAVLVVVYRHLAGDRDAVARLEAASVLDVATAALALVAVIVVNGIVLRDLVAHVGLRLPTRSWLGVSFVSGMLNQVSPVASAAAVRAAYLNRAYGVSLTACASLLGATVGFGLAAAGFVGFVAIASLGVPGGTSGLIVLASCGAVVLLVGVLLLVAPASPASAEAPRGRVARVLVGLQSIRRDRVLMARLAGWNLAAMVIYGIAVVTAFQVAGFDGDWRVAFAVSACARVGSIVAFTPAGLGITEAFGVVSTEFLGADGAAALVGLVVVRVLGVVVSVVGGAVAFPAILRELR